MEPTVMAVFGQWVINGVVSGVVANITYDGIKSLKESFKKKMLGLFEEKEELEEYFKAVAETPSINKLKPIRDVEDIYEEITKRSMPTEFVESFKEWIIENKDQINKMAINTSTINIQSQNAGRDILNIQGGAVINNSGDKLE